MWQQLHSLPWLLLALGACTSDADVTPEPPPGPPTPLTVMTFNVLCSFCDGTYDPWDERLAYFDDIFARHDPDLIGLQEISFESEVVQLGELVPGHEALFFRNEENEVAYPDATVFYRRERFELRSRGEYWLSPTPEVASSTGFAPPQLPRLVTWAELRDLESHRSIYFATTHVDNNAPSQEKSAPLLLERTAPWLAEIPVILLGDFNSQPSDEAYRILVEGTGSLVGLSDSQALADTWSVSHNQPTEPAYDLDARIDHIFVGPSPSDWSVESWTADLHVYGANDRYPSDHWPLAARLTPPAL